MGGRAEKWLGEELSVCFLENDVAFSCHGDWALLLLQRRLILLYSLQLDRMRTYRTEGEAKKMDAWMHRERGTGRLTLFADR